MSTNTTPRETKRRPGTGLSAGLWIAQVLLALAFGMSGWMKAATPIPELTAKVAWVADVPAPLVRFIAAAELAGAIGLLLPALTRILPVLTPLAGTGLATIMLLATVFHLRRGEMPAIGFTIVLGALAAFVAWGRFRKAPIAPRV
ncbi:MAG: DoxX family protein [Thermoanaerobaculia bacterium]